MASLNKSTILIGAGVGVLSLGTLLLVSCLAITHWEELTLHIPTGRGVESDTLNFGLFKVCRDGVTLVEGGDDDCSSISDFSDGLFETGTFKAIRGLMIIATLGAFAATGLAIMCSLAKFLSKQLPPFIKIVCLVVGILAGTLAIVGSILYSNKLYHEIVDSLDKLLPVSVTFTYDSSVGRGYNICWVGGIFSIVGSILVFLGARYDVSL